MPRQRSRLSRIEEQENLNRLSQLEKNGISIGTALEPSPEPDRLTLEQTQFGFARIYELRRDEFAVLLLAKMTVVKSGILTTDSAMFTPWDDRPHELWDPDDYEDNPYYKDLIGRLPYYPPTVLNCLLKSGVPLRRRQVEGVIIGHGYGALPSKYHDESVVAVDLLLEDERGNELSFKFKVRVDRSVNRQYEKRCRERLAFEQSRKGAGWWAPEREQPGDRKNVSPDSAIKLPNASALCGGPHAVRDR